MKDQKTLAYINLFGILGALGKLAELDDAARALLTGIKPISLGIAVSGGPHATLRFADGGCTQTEGVDRCDIKLAFSTAEKFNGMIDGTVTPIPRKGFTHIGFLTGTFVKLHRYSDPLSAAVGGGFGGRALLRGFDDADALRHRRRGRADRQPRRGRALLGLQHRRRRRAAFDQERAAGHRHGRTTMSSPSAARGRRTRAR